MKRVNANRVYIVLAFLLVALMLVGLVGCGSGEDDSAYLESEKQLEGMYEACKTIKLFDGEKELEPIKVEELEDREHVTVETTLKRSNGMEMPGTWVGASLGPILEEHGVETPFKEIKIEAWDGYIGRASYDVAMRPDTIIAYEENGGPIPEIDGPVRLVVGSEDGYFWVRMMTGIEVVR